MTDSAWSLIERGDFNAAIDAYTALLDVNPSPPNFANRALAHLSLEDFAAAEADYRAAQAHDHPKMPSDAYRNWIGVTQWLSGDTSGATQTWSDVLHDHDARRIRYTDAAGGVTGAVLDLFGGNAQGDAELVKRAEHRLQSLSKASRASWWPGPIAQFLAGSIDGNALLAEALGAEELRHRRPAQAQFAIALSARIRGDSDVEREYLDLAAKQHQSFEREYYLARMELRKLG